jgi:hypothetical protein
VDRWWLEGRWRRPPNTAWTRRGTDFGGSRDTLPTSVITTSEGLELEVVTSYRY